MDPDLVDLLVHVMLGLVPVDAHEDVDLVVKVDMRVIPGLGIADGVLLIIVRLVLLKPRGFN